MNRWLRTGSGAGLALWLGAAAAGAGDDPARFLTEDGTLRYQLTVRDGQQGVVGETGTVWVIEPSGSFRVSRFVNQKIIPPEREGVLSAAQVRTVAEALAGHAFHTLPPEIGAGAPVNPRTIRVVFGREGGVNLTLPPGPPVELHELAAGAASRADADADGRLLAVVDAVLGVTAAE